MRYRSEPDRRGFGRFALGDVRRQRHHPHRGHRAGKRQKIASAALEASESDSNIATAASNVVGTDRKISLFETAQRATAMGDSLDSTGKLDTPLTFPNGCHIAEIEIDPDTGKLDLVTYTAVDDCGNILSQTVVEGRCRARSPTASARR